MSDEFDEEPNDEFDEEPNDEDWCHDCGTPIGRGWCAGCFAVAASQEQDPNEEDPYEDLD